MKNFSVALAKWGAVAAALAVPTMALAIAPAPLSIPNRLTNINQITNGSGLVCQIINWIFWALIVMTIIFVLVAAFKYLTAAGDSEKVKSAGATLLYAVVAVVVALIAKGLPLIISSFIGGGLTGVGC